MDDRRAEDARLVTASRAGDPTAFACLFDRWFDPCVDVARRILHDRDAAADVAQEAFLAAWATGLGTLRDPGSFGGWVLRTSRNRALDRLERDRRALAVGDDHLARAVDVGAPPRTDEVAAVVTRAEDADLVWAASAALGARDASILDLHLRHELAAPEIAEALGVTPNNAHQLLFRLRKRLSGAIRAWVLWRDGAPACTGLAGALAAAGVTRFGPDAVRVTSGHVPDCDDCDSRQHLRLAPEALFAAVPLAPVAPDLRARAEAALQAEGVPVGPSRPRPGPRANRLGRPPHGVQARLLTLAGTLAVVAASVAAVASARPEPALQAVGDAAAPAGDPTGGATGEPTPTAEGPAQPPTTTVAPSTSTASTTPGEAPAPAPGPAGTDPAGGSAATGSTPAAAPGPDGSTEGSPSTTAPPGGPQPTSTNGQTTTTTTPSGDQAGLATGTDPPEAPSAPEVVAFTATGERAPEPCARGARRVTLAWETTGTTEVTLTGPGAPARAQPPSGSATACVTGSGIATFTVSATGAGGTASATATG